MTESLPTPGSDNNTWGGILNGFLGVAHNADGTLIGTYRGAGTPEGAVTAPIGSIYQRSDGGANTAVYRKESGTGNTGWVADSSTGSLALGETSTTAYRGDRGKTAYDTALAAEKAIAISDSAPATPANGDLWFDSDDDTSIFPTPADIGAAPASGIAPSAITGTALVASDTCRRAAARLTALGLTAETLYFPPTAGGVPTSQSVTATAVYLFAGEVVNNLIVGVTAAGVGTAPTLLKLGLYSVDAAGTTYTLRASSAEMKDDARWLTAQWVAVAMSAAYTIPTSGFYYCAYLSNGAFGTTALSIARYATTGILGNALPGENFMQFFAKNSQTDLPSPITSIATTSSPLYFGVN